MNPKVITKEISNEDLQSALELLYRSMGVIKGSEEVTDASFSQGPIIITFTIKDTSEEVIRISF